MFKTLKRTFLPLNRWYDGLAAERGISRFALFFFFVAIPMAIGQAYLITYPLIAIPALIIGLTLGFIRATAFL